jgi:vacuolar-type H+-ATPase subunit I/STV1
MKRLLSILDLALFWFSVSFAETIEDRLTKIEKRLEKIEQSLEPLNEFIKPILELKNLTNNTTTGESDTNTNVKECLKIDDFKASIITNERSNEYFPYIEYSYAITYSNKCETNVIGDPIFKLLDKDGLILAEDKNYRFIIYANKSNIFKSTMMVQGLDKIKRIHTESAGMSGLRVSN